MRRLLAIWSTLALAVVAGLMPCDSAHADTSVPAGTTLLTNSFESGYAGWSVDGTHNTVWTSNGQLILGIDKDANGTIRGGRVETGLEFTYGTFSFRARGGGPTGAHWAGWLQTVTNASGDAYYPGASEIDVAENFREDRGIWQTIWYTNANDDLVQFQNSEPDVDVNVWHTYKVDWTPTAYKFYVDGTLTYTVTSGLSSEPKFGILSYLVAGWELPNLQQGALGQYRVAIDWALFVANAWTTKP